jgi:manganese/iron transport system substrate-binding protein
MGNRYFYRYNLQAPFTVIIIICMMLVILSCQQPAVLTKGTGLKVVATTSLVGDVVSQVGGDKIQLEVLLPLGTDPHSFSPTPRDASIIADAAIVFANGVGLEEFLKPLMDNIGGASKVVEVSQGIVYRSLVEQGSRSNLPIDDPHTWMDPNNIIIWVNNIVSALSNVDPTNLAYYVENGQNYQAKLKDLDTWIRSEVSIIPEQNRKLVTDHLIFGYYADRYGFKQVGAIIPGFSSLAEPSAQDIAQIEDAIHSMGVKAIFINVGVNVNLAQRIANDTGTNVVLLYMESLSDKGVGADNYLEFMHYDVNKIINALK